MLEQALEAGVDLITFSSSSTVTNLMRLLNLAPGVRALVDQGQIEMGHARALLSLDSLDQERLARDVARRGLSVRQTEQLVRNFGKVTSESPARKDPDTQRLESDLSDRLGAPVQIMKAMDVQQLPGFTDSNQPMGQCCPMGNEDQVILANRRISMAGGAHRTFYQG